METIWRPKRYSLLPKELMQEKLRRDKEYELAVQELYRSLPHEEAQARKKVLWYAYVEWAKSSGFYERVTPEQQLAEAEEELDIQVEQVNLIRKGLGKAEVEVKEKAGAK